MAFVVRTGTEPGSAASAIESAIHGVDKDQAVYNVRAMRDVVSESLAPRRLRMLLIGLFAVLALGLASVGIYGIMSYSVAQRTHEIGIRVALGAGRSNILRAVAGHGLRLSLAGVASSTVLSFAVTRILTGMLFGVEPTDAATFLGVGGLLVTTALVASCIPALRATRIDPLASLRGE